MKKTSVYIETFGCQMNVADSERAATRLRHSGFAISEDSSSADVVIFNTCAVRAKAQQKVFNRIGVTRHSAQNGHQLIGVMGCVAQLEGEGIFAQAPSVRMIIGTQATDRLPSIIEKALTRDERILDVAQRREGEVWDVSFSERHSPHVAFVPIIEGCNKFCSYCIVPYSRGRERSRAASEIIAEINGLMRHGTKEVHLIGQNVNSYRPHSIAGLEQVSGATPFSRLLRAVAATKMPRIKFTTSFPRDFHSDIVAAMDENGSLCEWVHLPVQSGSDRMLRLMRRGYSSVDYLKRVDYIKRSTRNISLTSDVIVGFPGETQQDFEDTMRLVRLCRYDGLYIFKYSERKGTPAATMSDTVSESDKTARFLSLENIQEKIQEEIYTSYVGRELSVLVEGHSSKSMESMTGHSTCHKVVNFLGKDDLLGQIVSVRITEAKSHSLWGELV
jgi:tRNA-2-methylthio-N6-dimethylallyladenosine synthase